MDGADVAFVANPRIKIGIEFQFDVAMLATTIADRRSPCTGKWIAHGGRQQIRFWFMIRIQSCPGMIANRLTCERIDYLPLQHIDDFLFLRDDT